MNLLVVVFCIVLSQVLGAIWYGPLFGRLFLSLAYPGVPENAIKPSTSAFAASFFSWVACIPCLAMLIELTRAAKLPNAFAGLAWGLVVTTFDAVLNLNHAMWENRPVGLYLLRVGYHGLAFGVSGALIGYFI
eukprot:CAMPEP_0174893162 /NCGR_PEP_ID=MMETSP0167-20121228/7998_1 /TAXON_ID=38298 /ORGANISM="Rhodella maculata, Strain CCMP736" /LENGTH=132 /DNA_ID=CAMNT_0016131873 /DNA_START=75 /DNA_END=473 /DNA_ORIENTATION=+